MEIYDSLYKLIKNSQIPGGDDVCEGCIYNNNNKCTFTEGPQATQLPVGCPKRSDTQKVFELIRKIKKQGEEFSAHIDEDDVLHIYSLIHTLKRNLDSIKKIYPQNIKTYYGLDNASQAMFHDFIDQSLKVAQELAEIVKGNKELYRYALWIKDLLSTKAYPQIDYADEKLDDFVFLLENYNPNPMGTKNSFYRGAQVFAPGPGPWEGYTTNEISEEVSRGTPERWDAGPFEQLFQTHARMDTRPSQREIAEIARIWSPLKDKFIALIKKSQENTNAMPIPSNNQMEQQDNSDLENNKPITTKTCPRCKKTLPASQNICPTCNYSFREEIKITTASYRLCYFCGKPIDQGMAFTLVIDRENKLMGVSHLECAQIAAQQFQGNFDESDDFVVVNKMEESPKSESEEENFNPNDEIVLVEDFGEFKQGDLGRIVSLPELEEEGLSPVRVDGKVYVRFDKKMNQIQIVPKEKIEKTSNIEKIIKMAGWMQCPKKPWLRVLVVVDHCVYATDNPRSGFCTDKSCPYNQPVSPQEWDQLLDLEFPKDFPIFRRFF